MKDDDNKLDCNEFFVAKTREDVAKLLGIQEKSLRYFLYKRRPENMYTTFEMPKKNGKSRTISAPQKELKQIQRKLAIVLSNVYIPKVCAYGFIANKSILENATKHTGRKILLNIDLKDFFTQIHFGRIRGMLMKKPYALGEAAATTIAQIACLNGVLPQGAPSSPILTNMICAPLDNHLMRLAKQSGCTYTRYADDITFSTYKKEIPVDIVYERNGEVCLGKKLLSILKQNSFEVNAEKITLRTHYDRQEVTGLTVNAFPNVRRSYTKQLRAILHHCNKMGVYNTAKEFVKKGFCKSSEIVALIDNPDKQDVVEDWFRKVLVGKLHFIKQIKGEKNLTFLALAQKMNKVFNSDIFDISELDKLSAIANNCTFVLEEETQHTVCQGSGFYIPGYGLFTSYHVTQSGGFFKVYEHTLYQEKNCSIIAKGMNEQSCDETIDYALYNFSVTSQPITLAIGDSAKLSIGDTVITIGYPNHVKGNSPYIQECKITSQKTYLGAVFYTVSGRIVHGASGGLVLDEDYNVVGIIKGGIVTLSDDDFNENQGFIPMHIVLADIHNKQAE